MALGEPRRQFVVIGDDQIIDKEELWQRLVASLLEFRDQKHPGWTRTDGVVVRPVRRGRPPGGGLTPDDVHTHIQALKDAGEKVNRPALAKRMSCSLSHCKRLTRAAGLHGWL